MSEKADRKRILITGATSGIGLSTARYLNKLNYDLFFVGRSKDRLEKISDELDGIPYYICDFEHPENIKGIFEYCNKLDMVLDGMVHCAGFSADYPIKKVRIDVMERLYRIHCVSFVELCKYFCHRSCSNDFSSVVAVSSFSSINKPRTMAMYASAKSAVNVAVSVASKEYLGRNIRINAIAPALVDTPMNEGIDDIVDVSKVQPWGLIPPEQVSFLIEFLLSDKGRYITGAVIPISAGMEG